MHLTRRKLIAGLTFVIMFGGTALFALIAIVKGLPQGREVWINLWPVLTSVGTVVSFLALRKAERQDPLPPGSWQLTLADLLAATLTFGALLGIISNLCDDLEFIQALFVSLLITAVMIAGLLCASRIHIPRRRRALFGLTFALGVTGLLILGGTVTVSIFFLIYRHGELSDLYSIFGAHGSARLALGSLLVCLPAARYCYVLSRERQTTLPAPAGSPEELEMKSKQEKLM